MCEWASVLPRMPATAPSWSCTRSYPGTADQVAQARAFTGQLLHGCPVTGDATLLCSEICANAVLYSNSRAEGGQFRVHARVLPGGWVWSGVEDQGGPWLNRPPDPDRMHGLDLVRALVGDGGWGISGGTTGRLVWFRLNWPAAPADHPAPQTCLTTPGRRHGNDAARPARRKRAPSQAAAAAGT
jgi:hypothetical protein